MINGTVYFFLETVYTVVKYCIKTGGVIIINSNSRREVVTKRQTRKVYIGITEEKHEYTLVKGDSVTLDAYIVDTDFDVTAAIAGVTVTGYDAEVISVTGRRITARGCGSTYAYVEYKGFRTLILINVS